MPCLDSRRETERRPSLTGQSVPGGGGPVDELTSQPRAVSAGSGGERVAGADPPLLTGGSLHLYPHFSRGIDYLTFTCPEVIGRALCEWTEFDEDGSGKAEGFRKSERRLTLGGKCWRKMEPVSSSRAYGFAYECWEWDGAPAHLAAQWLSRREGRPSHIDVAWDFEVPPGLTSDVVAESIAAHIEAAGLKPGINGEGIDRTHYVGARSSERRLRIYRKDLQKGDLWKALNLPPVLRVELIVKKRVAHAAWAKWVESEEAFFSSCAGEVQRMTGLTVQGEWDQLPTLSLPGEVEPAAQVFQLLLQYGSIISDLDSAGLPLLELAAEFDGAATSRMARSRRRRRRQSLQALDMSYIVDLVRSMLHNKREMIVEPVEVMP